MNGKIFETLSGKYKIALLTTFNYDLEYFDNNIFYKFFVNGIKDVSVFVDSNQLQESLKKQKTNLGIRYSVIPFKMTKSFHPKVILLLDDSKAKLVVGSLNLTEKGYSHNQEIYNSFVYDKDNQDNLNLIIEAYKFFLKLNELSDEHDEEIFNKIKNIPYINRSVSEGEIKFISNLEESIYDQATKYVKGIIKKIDIAVPFYDNEASALSKIEELHPAADIKLYIQNEKSTFPQKLYDEYENKIYKFKKISCNECGNFYHGKIFRFITDNASYILYGSANCTNAAFMNSYNDGGNVECDILEKGKIGEFDELFLQFEKDYSEFTSYPIRDDNSGEADNFKLDHMEKDDSIKVSIKYKHRMNNIKIFINRNNDYNFSWEYVDNLLLVTIPPETVKEIGNVFKIIILGTDADFENTINCFFNDYDAISNYRNSEDNDKNIAKKILFKNDIFINDVIDLMYKMPNNAADAKRIKDNKKLYLEQKSETEESENDEEYIINEEVLLEYQKKYEEDSSINKAFNKIGSSYFNTLKDIIRFDEEDNKNNHNGIRTSTNNSSNNTNLDVSDEELEIFNRRCGKRIIKKIVNGILTDNYLEEIDYYDYKSYIGSIFLFFDKYTDYRSESEIQLSDEPKKDYLFEYKDVSSSKYDLSNALLNKLITEQINYEEEQENILVLCIQAIIQKYYSIEEYNLDDKQFILSAPKIIKKLDEIYYIRDSFIEYVRKALRLINYHKQIMKFTYIMMYLIKHQQILIK